MAETTSVITVIDLRWRSKKIAQVVLYLLLVTLERCNLISSLLVPLVVKSLDLHN